MGTKSAVPTYLIKLNRSTTVKGSSKQPVVEFIRNQSYEMFGDETDVFVDGNTVIRRLFDSFSFVNLIVKIEKEFAIRLSDENFYEHAVVTVDDLSKLVAAQQQIARTSDREIVLSG